MEILTWEVFEKYLHKSTPSLLNMGGNRGVLVGFNPPDGRVFLRIPTSPESSVPPNPYTELNVEISAYDSGYALEISTQAVHLFREFLVFAGIVTEDFEQPTRTALQSFEHAIGLWLELTSRIDLLSDEKQLGLFGELVFLQALITINGPTAIRSWTGRSPILPERHDFRLGENDIEVKSTRNTRRQHVIHGLEQLKASSGHTLYILSLRFEGAGISGGKSLFDAIKEIRAIIGADTVERSEFENRILLSGYRDRDAQHYQNRLIFADSPILALVDDSMPRIVRDTIELSLPADVVGRIEDVSYRINIDGLGVYQGSDDYSRILGKVYMELS